MEQKIQTRVDELLKEYETALKQRDQWTRRVVEVEGAVVELRKLLAKDGPHVV